MNAKDTDIRMRILLAAKRLFAQQGYDGTSVRQICEDAGVNVALISYYFGGKENMFQELFQAFFPSSSLEDYEDQLQDPIQGLRLFVTEVIRYRMAEPDIIKLLQQEIALNSPRIQIIRNSAFPIWLRFRTLLEEGREQGVFHFRSLDQTLLFVMGTMLFGNQRSYFEPLLSDDPPAVEELCEEAFAFIAAGLRMKVE